MKKFILLLSIVIIFTSCEQEELTHENTDNISVMNEDKVLEINANKFFGVFSTFDSELHGELRIDLLNDTEHSAIVTLVNSEVLKFKAKINKKKPTSVKFTGDRGAFTLDFSDQKSIIATKFLVDNKDGYVYGRVEPKNGGSLLMGTYIDDSDPTFTGNFDLFNYGALTIFDLPLIEDVLISHVDGFFYPDETAGVLESFYDNCWIGATLIGGVSTSTGYT